MSSDYLNVLLYALLPVTAMAIGSVAAAFKTPGIKFRSVILHFAAGVVFSVVAIELLPDIIEVHAPLEVAIGFGLGISIMLAISSLNRKMDKKSTEDLSSSKLPFGFLLAMAIDFLLDGFLLGIGFTAGAKEGILLTTALSIEIFSLGLAAVARLRNQGRTALIYFIIALSVIFLAGAFIGITLLRGVSPEILELVLSFGLAALLLLVTEELLTEAHEGPESPFLTASFFIGFLIFLILGMVT